MSSTPFNMGYEYWSDNNEPSTSTAGPNPLRPSVLGAHQMPEPSRVPWNPAHMPWTSIVQPNCRPNEVVEFKGDASTNDTAKCVHKRKAEYDGTSVPYAPIHKRHITDDHMADHLNSLHISSDFTTHQLQPTTATASTFASAATLSVDAANDGGRPINVPMTTKDLQRKLRNAQRITLCDQIRRIQSEPLLPGALLQRIERPCTALVLWQPSPKDVRTESQSALEIAGIRHNMNADANRAGAHGVPDVNQLDEGIEDDFGLDNNNSSALDLNSTMDMDL